MMQDRADDRCADMRLFLAQGVVAQHLERVIAVQFFLQRLVLLHRRLQALLGEMEIVAAVLLQPEVLPCGVAQFGGEIAPERGGGLRPARIAGLFHALGLHPYQPEIAPAGAERAVVAIQNGHPQPALEKAPSGREADDPAADDDIIVAHGSPVPVLRTGRHAPPCPLAAQLLAATLSRIAWPQSAPTSSSTAGQTSARALAAMAASSSSLSSTTVAPSSSTRRCSLRA